MTTNEQTTPEVPAVLAGVTSGKPASAPRSGRKPSGKVRTGNPQADREVRAAGNGSATKATAPAKPARQSRASRAASQAKAGPKAGTGAASIQAADKKKATPKAKPDTGPTFQDLRRELSRAVIVAAGELVSQYPREIRADLAQAISNQLHHLTTKQAGWPTKLLPVPDRSDWK